MDSSIGDHASRDFLHQEVHPVVGKGRSQDLRDDRPSWPHEEIEFLFLRLLCEEEPLQPLQGQTAELFDGQLRQKLQARVFQFLCGFE